MKYGVQKLLGGVSNTLDEFIWMGIMVLNFGSLLVLTIFILPNNFIPYASLMDDLICLQLNWVELQCMNSTMVAITHQTLFKMSLS
jgi:hypothetical protein